LELVSKPRWVRLKPGGQSPLTLSARLNGVPPDGGSAEGAVLLVARGAGPLRIPWAITFGPQRRDLISAVALSTPSFRPSDLTPAVLSLQAGLVVPSAVGAEVHPVARLDVELWRRGERLGLITRLRDLLPGRVAIGLTGRGPTGAPLDPGRYALRLVAVPTNDGPRTSRTIAFRIK
jgi:hypothetical protein